MSAIDAVKTFLRDRGLADEVVEAGAGGLIERWEQAGRELEREVYPFHVEDWLDELDGRQLLWELQAAVPAALAGGLQARLHDADSRIMAATDIVPVCLWGEVLAKRLRWKSDHEWWYWRRPMRAAADFEGEVGGSAAE